MDNITYITNIDNFQDLKNWAWAGAVDTLEIIEANNKETELIDYLNEIIAIQENEMIEETKLNDFLWFDDYQIFYELNIEEELTDYD